MNERTTAYFYYLSDDFEICWSDEWNAKMHIILLLWSAFLIISWGVQCEMRDNQLQNAGHIWLSINFFEADETI